MISLSFNSLYPAHSKQTTTPIDRSEGKLKGGGEKRGRVFTDRHQVLLQTTYTDKIALLVRNIGLDNTMIVSRLSYFGCVVTLI